jgi:hypothetical protein
MTDDKGRTKDERRATNDEIQVLVPWWRKIKRGNGNERESKSENLAGDDLCFATYSIYCCCY